MAHANRIEQLEDLRNVPTHQDFYEKLAAGKFAAVESHDGSTVQQYIPVPITLKAQMGSPTALAIGAFSTTLTSVACALMGFRGISMTNVFIADFLAVAGIGMVVSAQWELVLGNTYAYTVLSAFGFFYFGFGLLSTPVLGIAAVYGGADTPEYLNALGMFVLLWAVLNIFFTIGSLPLNLVYIGIFVTVEFCFTLLAAYYFLAADGNPIAGNVAVASGAFAFASGMLGFYTLANLMCQEALSFSFPMGDTSQYFGQGKRNAPVVDGGEMAVMGRAGKAESGSS